MRWHAFHLNNALWFYGHGGKVRVNSEVRIHVGVWVKVKVKVKKG